MPIAVVALANVKNNLAPHFNRNLRNIATVSCSFQIWLTASKCGWSFAMIPCGFWLRCLRSKHIAFPCYPFFINLEIASALANSLQMRFLYFRKLINESKTTMIVIKAILQSSWSGVFWFPSWDKLNHCVTPYLVNFETALHWSRLSIHYS